jgi:hypothetical protein
MDANCVEACKGLAAASTACSGALHARVEGSVPLQKAMVKYQAEIAEALGKTLLLKDAISKSLTVGSAIKSQADMTSAGAACMTIVLNLVGKASASINVSVHAAACVQGEG